MTIMCDHRLNNFMDFLESEYVSADQIMSFLRNTHYTLPLPYPLNIPVVLALSSRKDVLRLYLDTFLLDYKDSPFLWRDTDKCLDDSFLIYIKQLPSHTDRVSDAPTMVDLFLLNPKRVHQPSFETLINAHSQARVQSLKQLELKILDSIAQCYPQYYKAFVENSTPVVIPADAPPQNKSWIRRLLD